MKELLGKSMMIQAMICEKEFKKGDSFTIHRDNIQTLYIELYKVYNNIAETIVSNLFIRTRIIYCIRLVDL